MEIITPDYHAVLHEIHAKAVAKSESLARLAAEDLVNGDVESATIWANRHMATRRVADLTLEAALAITAMRESGATPLQ